MGPKLTDLKTENKIRMGAIGPGPGPIGDRAGPGPGYRDRVGLIGPGLGPIGSRAGAQAPGYRA